MKKSYRYKNSQAGFTLVELMVVVMVIAILASVAIPSYSGYVTDARRQGAAQEILTIASRQEQHFLDNKAYATSLTQLGYSAQPIGTNENGGYVGATDASAMYTFAITSTTATTSGTIRAYTISAIPKGSQLSRDTECGTLTLTEAGVKTAGGASNPDCW